MKATTTFQALIGIALMSIALFHLPSNHSATSEAAAVSKHELASTTGMSYQDSDASDAQDPIHFPAYSKCVKGQAGLCDLNAFNAFCSPDSFWYPFGIPGLCGGSLGQKCYKVTDGPKKNDACTSKGASEEDSCTLTTNNYCGEVETGTCTVFQIGAAVWCRCMNYGTPKKHYTRRICTDG